MRWSSQDEVCARLGISVRTLMRWRASGELSAYEFRGRINFDPCEVEDFKRRRRLSENGGQP